MTDTPTNVAPISRPQRRLGMTPEDAEIRKSFDFDDGSYDIEQFYVASTNRHDHSDSIALKLPKHVRVMINQFVAQQDIPAYKTANDLFRDAIVHRLHWLFTHYQAPERLQEWIEVETARASMDVIRAEFHAQDEVSEAVKEMIEIATARNDKSAMEEVVISCGPMLRRIKEPTRTDVIHRLRVGWVQLGMDLVDLEALLSNDEGRVVGDMVVEIGDAPID